MIPRLIRSKQHSASLLATLFALAAGMIGVAAAAGAAEPVGGDGPKRALRVGVTTVAPLFEPFSEGAVGAGGGLGGTYEFLLSPRFALGVHMGYRHHAGSAGLSQLNYGLMMKHYLGAAGSAVRPYLEYGLLMLVSFRRVESGSGTSHDTRLAAGTDIAPAGLPLYADLAYHYSRLSWFGTEPERLDYLELVVGARWRW